LPFFSSLDWYNQPARHIPENQKLLIENKNNIKNDKRQMKNDK